MSKTSILSFTVVAVACGVLFAGSADSQGTPKNLVILQGSTPGMSQSGHVNISGALRSTSVISDSNINGAIISATNANNLVNSIAIFGHASSTATSGATYGVQGLSSSQSGVGVFGNAPSASGNGIGVRGNSGGTTGTGGYFTANGTTAKAVYGFVSAGTGATIAGHFQTNSNQGFAVYGEAFNATGITYGVYGKSLSVSGSGVYGESVDNVGVRGYASATSGANYGVYGQSASGDGYGIYAYNSSPTGTAIGLVGRSASTSGTGILAQSNGTSGFTYGLQAENASPSGTAVFARTTSTSGNPTGLRVSLASNLGTGIISSGGSIGMHSSVSSFSVAMRAESSQGFALRASNAASSSAAILGENTNTGGSGYGVHGVVNSFTADAIRGENLSGGYGVVGYAGGASSSYKSGVYGACEGDGNGVAGSTSTTNIDSIGVIGYTQVTGADAVFAFGNFSGTGAKAFKIDHPLDPENYYLKHYCTEGQEPLNVYSGNVTTDRSGYATVQLPDYFEAVNTNVRYQLTVVEDAESEDFVLVKVIQKVKNNQFRIKTSVPNVEVSWRVEAKRNDPYMQAHPAKDVVEKSENRKGKYLHPELYGQPDSKSIFSDARAPISKSKIAK